MKCLIFLLLFVSDIAMASGYSDEEKAYIKSEWGIDVEEAESQLQNKENEYERIRSQIKDELNNQYTDMSDLAYRADRSMEVWIRLATFLLEKKGYRSEAQRINDDYLFKFRNQFSNAYVFGFGDHYWQPWSLWLEDVYQVLLEYLGETTLRLLHLDDIHWVNFSIPVSLQPAGDDRVDPIILWPKDLYVFETSENFAGPIAYWSVYAVCVGTTFGTAAAFACSPIGIVSETIVANRIAPPLAERIWDKNNPQ